MTFKRIILVGIILLGATLVWSLALIYSHNSPANNGRWISEMCNLEMRPVTSFESLASRTVFAGGVLGLQKYGGNRHMTLAEPKNLKEAKWSFLLPSDSYLDFIFNDTGNEYSGIRISSSPEFQSQIFLSDKDGRFIRREAFELTATAFSWQEAEFLEKDNKLILKLDGKELPVFSSQIFKDARIGFRSGPSGASVRSFSYTEKTGKFSSENFQNFHLLSKNLLLKNFLLVLLAVFLLVVLTRVAIQRSAIFLFSLGAIWFSTDFFHYSQFEIRRNASGWLYPFTNFEYFNIENVRSTFFSSWADLVDFKYQNTQTLIEQCPVLGPKFRINFGECVGDSGCVGLRMRDNPTREADRRILVLGGSTTQGGGARHQEDIYYKQMHAQIQKRIFPSKLATTTMVYVASHGDASLDRSQSVFRLVLDKFGSKIIDEKYDVAIINFGISSKADWQPFENLLKSLKKHKTKLFLLTPSARGRDFQSELAWSRNFSRLAKEYELTEIILSEILTAAANDGQVWWDNVHPTSYGHGVVAQKLTQELLPHLQN